MTVQTDEYLLALDLPVSAERLYQSWLDEASHAAMIGADVVAEDGEFLIWDGYIRQRIVEAEPSTRLVLAWRTEDFPADAPDSHLELRFLPLGPEQSRLELTHRGIPAGKGSEYSSGFEDYYFAPMVRFFGGDTAIAPTGGFHQPPPGEEPEESERDEHEVDAHPSSPVVEAAKPPQSVIQHGGNGAYDPKTDPQLDEEDDDEDDFWGESKGTVDIRPQAPAATRAPDDDEELEYEAAWSTPDHASSAPATPAVKAKAPAQKAPAKAPAKKAAPATATKRPAAKSKTPAKKVAAKASKKPAAQKSAPSKAQKKPAAKAKAASKKPAGKKPTPKKSAAKKSAAKKSAAKKPAAKKPAAKKPAAKKSTKPAAKKSTAKKPVAKAKGQAKPGKSASGKPKRR